MLEKHYALTCTCEIKATKLNRLLQLLGLLDHGYYHPVDLRHLGILPAYLKSNEVITQAQVFIPYLTIKTQAEHKSNHPIPPGIPPAP